MKTKNVKHRKTTKQQPEMLTFEEIEKILLKMQIESILDWGEEVFGKKVLSEKSKKVVRKGKK